jgi:hypothetical protein
MKAELIITSLRSCHRRVRALEPSQISLANTLVKYGSGQEVLQ